MKNHKLDIRNGKLTNPIVKHMFENDHPVNVDDSRLVKRVSVVGQRKLIETVLINSVPNFNIYQNIFNVDSSICNILLSDVKEINNIKKQILDPDMFHFGTQHCWNSTYRYIVLTLYIYSLLSMT